MLQAQALSGDEHGKVQCDKCNKYFLFKSRLAMHKKYHHKIQCDKQISDNTLKVCKPKGSRALQYRCEFCTKRFSSKHRMILHEHTHGPSYCFQCSVCNKRFAKMSALKVHKHSHSSLRQFKCEFCDKIYKFKSSLKKHKEIYHNIKNIVNNKTSTSSMDPNNVCSVVKLPITGNPLPSETQISPITNEQSYLICNVSHHIDIAQPSNDASGQPLQ